ncbi:MAG TPA: hypothetical protein DCG87_04970 [Synergistaceae bacterium]|nr:hypothetical protein [Synergistaceae bacterium]
MNSTHSFSQYRKRSLRFENMPSAPFQNKKFSFRIVSAKKGKKGLFCYCKKGGEITMPIVRIELWAGRSNDSNIELAKAITDVVVEKVGCPVEAVTVKIEESPKENWVIGGKPATEMHK